MRKIGIDIIGFPRGKLGVGEQSRALARVALAAGYDINFIDCYHPTDNIRNDDAEFEAFIGTRFCYPLRIFSLTQPHIGALLYRNGVNFFKHKHNIFHLAWEFDTRPTNLDHALLFADEIWGISTYTSRSFANDWGIPVHTMPNALTPLDFEKKTRASFNLPEDLYLFYATFDVNSSLARKNPAACIKAFQQAFQNQERVGLVLKASNVKDERPAWRDLQALIGNDDRIFVITEVFSREVMTAFCHCCDAYVSLHRSEGFGLGLIEAFNLKKPVICTAYSGNMDFCTEDTAYLVDYSLVLVRTEEYPYADNFLWAAPSIANAAEQMCAVYAESGERERKINAAFAKSEEFSVKALAPKLDALMEHFISRKAARG